MSYSEAFRRITGAGTRVDRAIQSLIALDPGPDFVEPLESAASLLAEISPERIPAGERAEFLRKVNDLSWRVGQAEALLQSAGALRFGSFLNNSRINSGYTADGTPECPAERAFRIDG